MLVFPEPGALLVPTNCVIHSPSLTHNPSTPTDTTKASLAQIKPTKETLGATFIKGKTFSFYIEYGGCKCVDGCWEDG